jgi:hypothetical protein
LSKKVENRKVPLLIAIYYCGSAVLQGSVIKDFQFADDKDLLAEEESQL